MTDHMQQLKTEHKQIYKEKRMMYCILVLIVLFTVGKNFSTTCFYISQDLFKQDVGISDKQLSWLFACGYLSSFPAKLIAGHIADANGSSALIVFCMGGFFIGTLLLSFVPSGRWAIYLALPIWSFTTFFSQGVFRVVSRTMAADWIPSSHLGRLMSVVTLAPNLGDAVVRLALAPFLVLGWQVVLRISTLFIVLMCLPFAVVALRTAPPQAVPDIEATVAQDLDKAVERAAASRKSKQSGGRTLHLLKNPDMWVLCCLSSLMFATRTLFLVDSTNLLGKIKCPNDNSLHLSDPFSTTPQPEFYLATTTLMVDFSSDLATYDCLHSQGTLRAITAASSIYTLVGAISTLCVGAIKDASPKKHRAVCLVPFVAMLFVLSTIQIYFGEAMGFEWTVARLALTGFCLFGPYKIISVFAVDIGGKEFKGAATGLVGASESAGAVLILLAKGWAGDDWRLMFIMLAAISFVCLMLSIKLWIRDLLNANKDIAASALLPLLQTSVLLPVNRIM